MVSATCKMVKAEVLVEKRQSKIEFEVICEDLYIHLQNVLTSIYDTWQADIQ